MKKLKINITKFPYADERQRKGKEKAWREVFEYWMTNIPHKSDDKYLFCHMLWIRQIGYKALENKRV